MIGAEVQTAIETKIERSSASRRRVGVARVAGLLSVAVFIGSFWGAMLMLLSPLTGMSLSTVIVIGSLIGLFCGVMVGLVTLRSR